MRDSRVKASVPRESVLMHHTGLPYYPPRSPNRKRDRKYSELPAGLGKRKIAVQVKKVQTDSAIVAPTRPILSENPNE
jgi:hypothetical protein